MGSENTFWRRASTVVGVTVLAMTAILAGTFAPSLAQEAKSKAKEPAKSKETAKPKDVPAAPASDYGLAQVREINKQIAVVWKDKNLSPSPVASDSEWCRRL